MQKVYWFRAPCGATLGLTVVAEGYKLVDSCPRGDVEADMLAVLCDVCEGCTFDARSRTTGTEKEPILPKTKGNKDETTGATTAKPDDAEAQKTAQQNSSAATTPPPPGGSVPTPPGMSQALNLPMPPGLHTSQPGPTSQPAVADASGGNGLKALNLAMGVAPAVLDDGLGASPPPQGQMPAAPVAAQPETPAAVPPAPVAQPPVPPFPVVSLPVPSVAQPGAPVAQPVAQPMAQPVVQPGAPVQPGPEGVGPEGATGVFGTPASAGSGDLLGQLLVGVGGEEMVDVNAVIDSIEGIEGGPSRGGISWHTLEPATQCWRKAYWQLVRGIVPKQTSRALAFGSLFHACWELWYRFGGARRYDEPCDAVRHAGAPKLAGEVQRLVYAELQRFAEEEAQTWDVRAVEQNAIFWLGPHRIHGKQVFIPITCRHDLILAKREPGAPCAPAGPAPQGCYVYDHKTVSALTYDTTKGYGMDPQFLTNALVYLRSDEPARFGALNGVIIGAAAKHKEPGPRSFFRIETTVDEGAIEEFCREEVEPMAIELYRRLSDPAWRDDKARWPKNHSQCVGRYGCCRYFDLCDVGGESIMEGLFKVDESRVLKLENFAEPPAEARRVARGVNVRSEAAAAAKKQRSSTRAHHKDLLLDAFSSALQTLELFRPSGYLVPNHTERGVLTQLQATLKKAWVNENGEYPEPYDFGPDAEGNVYVMMLGEKSIKWQLKQPEGEEPEDETGKKKKGTKAPALRGTLSYKAVAEAMCKDWWDLKNLEKDQAR